MKVDVVLCRADAAPREALRGKMAPKRDDVKREGGILEDKFSPKLYFGREGRGIDSRPQNGQNREAPHPMPKKFVTLSGSVLGRRQVPFAYSPSRLNYV